MSEPDKPDSPPLKRPGPVKAAFKVQEKSVKLEKIPELEQAKQTGKAKTGPPQGQPPQSPLPKISIEDFRGYIMLGFDKYNQALDSPLTGDPKARYRLDKNDADALIAVTTALDAKYHFMGRWVEYFPEIMAVIVIAGILGKVAMGLQYKQKEAQTGKGATPPAANVEARAPPVSSGAAGGQPNPLQNVKERVQAFFRVPGREEGPPPELVRDAMAYFETMKNAGAAKPANP